MESRSIRVTVVLPTYNRADVLARSIRSVLGQTFEEYELIVVDDGSTDGTEDAVKQFDDDRIQYIKHDRNRGAAAARNTGITASEGEIIAFQDSDDVWARRKLAKQIRTFERRSGDVGVVYTGTVRRFQDSDRYVPGCGVDQKAGDIQDSILEYNFVTTQAAAVRKQCFTTAGNFDESLPALIDWELWIRISKRYAFEFINEQLVTAHVQEESISTDDSAIVMAREQIVQKHRHRFDEKALARQLFWIGHGAIKIGATPKGQRYLGKAARIDPQLRYLGALGLSLFGSRLYQSAYSQYKSTHAASS